MRGKRRRCLRESWISNDLLVRAPGQRWRMISTVVAMVSLGFGLLVVINNAPPGPVRALASGGMGLFIGWGGLGAYKRIHAYRLGWVHGRIALVRSLREAYNRGMSPGEWMQAEYERDMATMGRKPRRLQERTEESE